METDEYKKEIYGSVDVSLTHKAIYIPVMKAGTQMFQEVFKKRFHGQRIHDSKLLQHIGKLNLKDFFVFTFVREPFSMFKSGYGEMSLYAANGGIKHAGFAELNFTKQNEPKRSIKALEDVSNGLFNGLVPAHLHTSVWKINRCVGKIRQRLKIDFVGKIENIENDFKYIENQLKVNHQPLPIIHSSSTSKERMYAKKFLNFNNTKKFEPLLKKICDYYKSDFVCFNYDNHYCNYNNE